MESKSPLPFFLAMTYVNGFAYLYTSMVVSVLRHRPPTHIKTFPFEIITLCSPGGLKLAMQAILAQNLELPSCLHLPSATIYILGTFSLNSLLPQVMDLLQ